MCVCVCVCVCVRVSQCLFFVQDASSLYGHTDCLMGFTKSLSHEWMSCSCLSGPVALRHIIRKLQGANLCVDNRQAKLRRNSLQGRAGTLIPSCVDPRIEAWDRSVTSHEPSGGGHWAPEGEHVWFGGTSRWGPVGARAGGRREDNGGLAILWIGVLRVPVGLPGAPLLFFFPCPARFVRCIPFGDGSWALLEERYEWHVEWATGLQSERGAHPIPDEHGGHLAVVLQTCAAVSSVLEGMHSGASPNTMQHANNNVPR